MAYPQYKSTNVPIFTGPPSWDSGVKLTPAYRTQLYEALDTSEERHSLLPRPLYGIGYRTLTLTANETAYLRKVIELAKEMPVGVPIWPMRTKLTVAASAGASSLTVDDVDRRLWDVFHNYALIWRDYDTWEVIELSSASGTAITLNAVTSGAWAVGDTVVPLLFGHLGRQTFHALTDENAQVEVQCNERFHGIHDQTIPEGATDFCAIILLADGGGDCFECHATSLALSGLSGGSYFSGPWSDAGLFIDIMDIDEFESYTAGASVNGLSGGTVWGAAWVSSDLSVARLDGGAPITTGSYRYYRLQIIANNGDANFSGILEMQYRESVGGADQTGSGTASASSYYSGLPPALAFDDNVTSPNGWACNTGDITGYLQYDFGASNEKTVVEYVVGSHATTTSTAARSIKEWKLQGSNNAIDWTDLHQVDGQDLWTFGQMRTFPVN